jgi:hypothetical protein
VNLAVTFIEVLEVPPPCAEETVTKVRAILSLPVYFSYEAVFKLILKTYKVAVPLEIGAYKSVVLDTLLVAKR